MPVLTGRAGESARGHVGENVGFLLYEKYVGVCCCSLTAIAALLKRAELISVVFTLSCFMHCNLARTTHRQQSASPVLPACSSSPFVNCHSISPIWFSELHQPLVAAYSEADVGRGRGFEVAMSDLATQILRKCCWHQKYYGM
eukprot:1157296-Pelagomonas_calceolata.AAC.6